MDDGIRVVVPVWRNDAGNAGLASAVRTSFSARGGSVAEGVTYGVETQGFSATVTALRAGLEQAVAQHGSSRVAVYLAAFDEVVAFFAIAQSDPVLASVRWYGSDAVAQRQRREATRVPQICNRTGYPNPVFGLDEGARDIWEPLAQRILVPPESSRMPSHWASTMPCGWSHEATSPRVPRSTSRD